MPQTAAVEIGYGKPPPRPKGTARKVAEQTGVSVDTVRRLGELIAAQRKTVGLAKPSGSNQHKERVSVGIPVRIRS